MLDRDDVKTIHKLAEAGQPETQTLLGMLYLNGNDECGVRVDKVKAKEWLSKAANQGNSEAQLYLGAMYVSGDGIEADITKGLLLVTQSAMNKNTDALKLLHSLAEDPDGLSAVQYVLGCMYLQGRGVEQDKIEARRLLKKSRNQGDEDASFMLGIMSADEEDYETAFTYITEAASRGQKDAIELLGNIQQNSGGSNSSGGVLDYVSDAVASAAKSRLANKALDIIWDFLIK